MSEHELLIATRNAGKIRELEELLNGFPVKLRSLNDFPGIVEPEETGATFAENAVLKAVYYARQTELLSLADDSGLEVEALGGAPGVYSARYAGVEANDSQRIEKLLEELAAAENRKARFVCAAALADSSGEVKFLAEGVCGGRITASPRGTQGFGYDPIFVPEGYAETFGELPGEVKRRISHRARAMDKIIAYLRDFIVI